MEERGETRREVLRSVFGWGILSWIISSIKQLFGIQDSNGTTQPNNKPQRTDQEPPDEPNEEIEELEEDEEQEEENSGPAKPENGAIVFVYDDGPITDYTQALPAHEEFDAPATTGIVSEWVGRTDYMGTEELDELVDAGWEIASHTKEHRPLGAFSLLKDIHPTDTEVSAKGYRQGHHEGSTVEISDGETKVTREVAGLGGAPGERRIALTEPVGESFSAEDTEIRHPAETMHETLGDSKDTLEEMGYDVSTLLAPYDAYSGYSDLFVPEYYDGVANARHGSRINDPAEYNPYETKRDYFIEFTTETAVKRDLDEIAEEALLGVFGAHTVKKKVNEDSIRQILEWVEEREIEVLTLREAISIYADESETATSHH
ncbi:polysaccharide deacetylase family protein [Halalkalicoccus jeotgali]|uniref:polysaccharide deacetylase family protein n=1 Tax=Halalkalicoccus jeotgali TaxID=413810 RepID=UPI00067760F1|nr:polysaccharide deacetylase family protein [Halalkalicoccus jeotgali]